VDQTIDEGHDAGSMWEDVRPLAERLVGGEHDRERRGSEGLWVMKE
jgi:hypothetical protein